MNRVIALVEDKTAVVEEAKLELNFFLQIEIFFFLN